jgi:hypothetical protein
MPDGETYVWDAWCTTSDSNPNIVLFVKLQADYGVREGGSGKPTVLDHPLHIALFEGNFRQYQPPHLRSLTNEPRLLLPQTLTPVYPQRTHNVLRRSHGPIDRLHIGVHRGGIAYSMSYRVPVEQSPPPPYSSNSEIDTPSSEESLPIAPLVHSPSPPPESPEPPPISYSDYHPRRPFNPISARYFDSGSQSIDLDDLMNPAELSNSSTVQGGNVVNVAVEHHAPALSRDVTEEYSTNAATIAQTTIVIEDDDASSRGYNVQLYQFQIAEQDNAGKARSSRLRRGKKGQNSPWRTS